MNTVEGILHGFSVALRPDVLVYCVLGVVMGTFIGVLPGIGRSEEHTSELQSHS